MLGNIIAICNSKGVRIPKVLLAESELGTRIRFQAKKGEIKIVSAGVEKKKKIKMSETMILSEKALSDWNRPEEDEAWASYQ